MLYIQKNICIFDDDIPSWISDIRLDSLVKKGYVGVGSSKGRYFYGLQPDGLDALAEDQLSKEKMRKQRTRQKNQREADARQQMLNKKQELRNQFIVAAFSVALTLLVEHFGDVVDFASNAVKTIFALFH